METTRRRLKTCRICKTKFSPCRTTQVACSPSCALAVAESTRTRREKQDIAERKAKMKTKAAWLKEAQSAFNKWVRLRDAELPCISCGRFHQGQYHAGHYRTTKAAPELRFEPDNVHKQCSVCNNHLSGNIVEYRIGLQFKIGTPRVEWIEGPHEAKRYTIDDLKQIKKEYTLKAKELQKKLDLL